LGARLGAVQLEPASHALLDAICEAEDELSARDAEEKK
jgi:hypothetical protein